MFSFSAQRRRLAPCPERSADIIPKIPRSPDVGLSDGCSKAPSELMRQRLGEDSIFELQQMKNHYYVTAPDAVTTREFLSREFEKPEFSPTPANA